MYKLISLVVILVSVQAEAASFDCQKASSSVEKIICADKYASNLDEIFAKAYSHAYGRASAEEKVVLRSEQILWLKRVRNQCGDAKCISDAYYARMEELRKYQHDPERINVKIDGKDVFVFKLYNPNERNDSFNTSGGSQLNGKIEHCAMLIDLPVGTARGNHSYGAYCSLSKLGSTELVKVCNDEMVGHFRVETIGGFGDVIELAKFVKANCVGG